MNLLPEDERVANAKKKRSSSDSEVAIKTAMPSYSDAQARPFQIGLYLTKKTFDLHAFQIQKLMDR